MTSRSIIQAAVLAALGVGLTAPASALMVTERADLKLRDADTNNFAASIDTIAAPSGSTFSNTWQRVNDTDGTDGGVTALATGDRVVSVFGTQVTQAVNGSTFQPIVWLDSNDNAFDVIMTGAIEGAVTNLSPTQFVLNISSARVALTAVERDSYERRDPTTWGISDGQAGADNNVLNEWVIKPPEEVQQGLGEPVGTIPADQINESAVNSDLSATATDGTLIAKEDSGNGPVDLLHTDAPGDDMVTLSTNSLGLDKFIDSILFTFKQDIERFDMDEAENAGEIPALGLTGTIDGFGNESPLLTGSAAVLQAMNDMVAWAGITTFGGTSDFASGFGDGTGGSLITDFNVAFDGNGINQFGDFRAFNEILNAHPAAQTLPEPSSIALMSLGLLGFGYSSRRRSAKRA